LCCACVCWEITVLYVIHNLINNKLDRYNYVFGNLYTFHYSLQSYRVSGRGARQHDIIISYNIIWCIILLLSNYKSSWETLKYTTTTTTIWCKSPGGLGNILDAYNKDVRNWRPHNIYVQIGRLDNNIFVYFTTDVRSRLHDDGANNIIMCSESQLYCSLFYPFICFLANWFHFSPPDIIQCRISMACSDIILCYHYTMRYLIH